MTKKAVTDRALRYRANRQPPPEPRVCHYCGSDRNVEVEHIDGREENTNPENLTWACRACNARKGAYFARLHLGRLTRQYNPSRNPRGASTLTRWLNAVLSVQGAGGTMAPPAAIATIQRTPQARRARYARQLAAGKVAAAARRNPEIGPEYEQYLWAVTHHDRGAHDDGGKVIHATPPAKRREYATKIAQARRAHGSQHLTGKRKDVPF